MEWYGSCDTRGDNGKLSYYEEFLEDLQHWNIESKNSVLSLTLKDKIQTLKLEVRYILPYTTCCLATEDKAYEETKRCCRIKNCPNGLVEFIEYVIQQICLVKPDCTGFYSGALISECNWSKFTDCVLDNLKYVQSLDDNLVCYPKEQLKHIEESLRFIQYFFMVMSKWNFWKLANTEAKIHKIYESMGSASRAAALVFELFKVGNFDGSDAEEVKMKLSIVQEGIYGCELRAKKAYFEILAGMKLCLPDTCPLTSETLHCLIDSLLDVLHEVSTYLQLARNSREGEIREMIKEIDFLKRILKDSLNDLLDHGKLDALATHIDVLACEADAFVGELEEMEDCETMAKILSLFAKIKRIKHEIRLSNKKDEIFIHCFIKDFLNSMRSLHAAIFVPAERADGLDLGKIIMSIDEYMACEHPVVLELRFLQAFLRCTQKWCINHPRLEAIRIRTESMVRHTWWDIRCLSFKKNTISEKVAIDKIEFLLSYMVQQLTFHRPEVIEICTEIRDSIPSSPCPLCKKFGLSFADAQCRFPKNSFSANKKLASELAVLFERLHRIAGNLLIDRKGPNGLLTFLEDLMDRGACLSYLLLVGKTNEVTSLKELIKEIEYPGVSMFFYRTIASPTLNSPSTMQPRDEQMLASANFLIQYFEALMKFNDRAVKCMIDYLADVLRDLILVKCILTNPLNQYFEQEELDKLLNDIGVAVLEAGVFLFFTRVDKSKENLFFRVKDVVRSFRASVSQVYSRFSKLSPSKLPVSEMGSLESLLWNLMRLIKSDGESTGFPLGQIEELQNGLQNCNSFLGHTKLKQDEEGMTKRLRARIMSIGCQVESSIDTFDDVPLWFFKMRVSDFTEEVKVIEEEIIEMGIKPLPDGSSSDKMSSQVVGTGSKAQDEVIGFEDEEDGLVRQLTTGSQLAQVISIVGMPGSGKTTLAMKVYETVARSFHCCAWCYVSQNDEKKGLLQQIINDIEGPGEDTKDLNEEDLAQKLYQILKKKKDYLIVLDDVWDIKVWNQLRTCFPRGNNRNKILLTSRYKDVGLDATSSDASCISLNLISPEKSWVLLKNRVFGARSCPEHLRDIGMEIADKCGGLPLSLVVIAGVLKNIEEKEQEWDKVSENLNSLVKNQDDILDKLELSYKHLPIHLKQCFLYCGALMSTPIRHGEIRRSKLAKLWVAERLIEETGENQSVEEVAESYLMDLISRSLLIVVKRGSGGRVRTCRIHDLLRDFCIWKGHEEQFLLTRIDTLKAFPNWPRRICICLHELFEVKYSQWSKPRINTLIHSGCGVRCLCMKYGKMFHILKKFSLLHVLDLESGNMGDTFPEGITEMTMLRYLAVSTLMHSMISIPSSIINLTNLETLIVKGKKDIIVKVPYNIFGLKKLRHLVVTPYTHLFGKSFNSSDCLQLETLETVVFCCCDHCQDNIPRLKRLKKLKCILVETIKIYGIPHLDSLDCLEYLKAQYFSEAPELGKFSLPNLPASLKKITLSGFELGWSEMGSIADLPYLEYLKLHDGAFKGNEWETEYEFPSLKYLKLDNLDIQEWIASEEHFPCLEWLVVRGCEQLKVLPPEFSDIATLKCIEVDQCCRSVADSAIEIEDKQRNYSGNKEFKSIIGLTTEEMVHDGEPTNMDKLSAKIISGLAEYDFYEIQS